MGFVFVLVFCLSDIIFIYELIITAGTWEVISLTLISLNWQYVETIGVWKRLKMGFIFVPTWLKLPVAFQYWYLEMRFWFLDNEIFFQIKSKNVMRNHFSPSSFLHNPLFSFSSTFTFHLQKKSGLCVFPEYSPKQVKIASITNFNGASQMNQLSFWNPLWRL